MKLVLITEKTKSDRGADYEMLRKKITENLVRSIVYTKRLNIDWLKCWNDGFSRENKYILESKIALY